MVEREPEGDLNVTACLYEAQLSVLCIAERFEPLPGVEEIERLAIFTLERMRADACSWPLVASQSKRILPHCGQTIQVKGNGLFRRHVDRSNSGRLSAGAGDLGR
jgi:hypothetical protein